MQLFSRSVQMTGAPAEIMSYASDMRAYVSDKTGREIALWSNVFGAPVGSMSYAVRVDGVADLRAMTTSLMDDAEYHTKLAEGQSMIAAPAVDVIAQPIHGELGDPPPVGWYASVTTATMAIGKYAEALAWGVQIAQHVEKVTEVPTMFLTSEYGGFGDVAWIAVVPDAGAVDASTAALSGDADYLASVDAAAGLFIDGSGHQSLATRVA